jgi:hypothetical protein
MASGVYSLTADMIGVDLTTQNWDVPNINDTSQAKGGAFWTASPTQINQPWRMSIDALGNLLVADWSDAYGGVKWLSPNMTDGGLVLDVEGGPTGGATNGSGQPIHGSIVSKPISTGSVNNNLTLWAMDEDLHQSLTTPPPSSNGYHVWKWDVGGATNYANQPQIVFNTSSLLPTPALPRTTDGRLNFVSSNGGTFTANAHFDAARDRWYLTENRFDGDEAGLIVLNSSGQLLWSSLQFSIDNKLDGNTAKNDGGSNCNGSASCAVQDIFRGMGAGLAISPDGTKLYMHVSDIRNSIRSSNPHFGTTSGEVLIIPLDANGIPNIHVNRPGDFNNDTKVDAADYVWWRNANGSIADYNTWRANFGQTVAGAIDNVTSIKASVRLANLTRRELTVDAAGNIYIGNSDVEWVRIFSPGGASVATTRSNGTFNVVPYSPAAGQDLSGVPEPSSLALFVLAAGLAAGRRGRFTSRRSSPGTFR